MSRFFIVAIVVGVLFPAACSSQPTAAPTAPALDMANPASKFCAGQGYKWESRTEGGGEAGYCLFPDGTECDEWAFYRGECGPDAAPGAAGMPNPASVHCEEQGGKLEIRTEAGGEVGYCLFDDGTECDEWAFFRGDCAPGEAKP